MRSLLFLLPVVLACACSGSDDTGPGDDTNTVDDTGATGDDTATTDDTGAADDTGSPDDTATTHTGAMYQIGEAVADPDGYVGTEQLQYSGEDQAILCLISYDLNNVASLDDCDDCAWAFELELSNATVLSESGPGCMGVAGYDSATVSALDGTTVSYGYAPEYFGHAQMLMMKVDGDWQPGSYANWDEDTQVFTYAREGGFFEY